MRKIRVDFFSCEPGGAEVLIPVIEYLQKRKDYGVKVFGYGLGLQRFLKKGVKAAEIGPVKRGNRSFLDFDRPDIVITSATSLPQKDMSEKNIWFNARTGGIKTIAFVDAWQNYSMRFSGPSKGEHLAYQPDYISCIDLFGKQGMEEEGFDPQILVPLGQPYLASLKKKYDGLSAEAIRKKLKIERGIPVLLFVSEALEENFGHARGYTQFDALRLSLRELMDRDGDTTLLVKLHPKDIMSKFIPFRSTVPGKKMILAQDEVSSLECLKIADEVFGISSIMLVEAYILGKRVISVQPSLKVPDPLFLSRYGYIPRVNSFEDFAKIGRKRRKKELNVRFDRKRFMDLLRQLTA